jgi:septum formation protein
MIDLPLPLVLASGSPRRRELLAGAGLRFEVRPAELDEVRRPGEAPVDYVRRLSADKADAVAGAAEIVLAADTTVELGGEVLEKPTDASEAKRMLRALSGRTHHAHTGVTVRAGGRAEAIVVSTAVTFVELTDAAIDWYVSTGEAADKAGAYGIQGAAGAFVERVDGSVTNVIGLPLAETLGLLVRVSSPPVR